MKLQAEQRLFIASFAVISLLAVLVINTVHSIRARTDSIYLVNHTRQVQESISRVQSLVNDAEIAVLDYALSNDLKTLIPYYRARTDLPVTLDTLKYLISDNPEQEKILNQVQQTIQHRLELHDWAIERKENGQNILKNPSLFSFTRNETGYIHELTRQMSQREGILLQQRSQTANENIEKSNRYMALALACMALLATAVYLQIHRQVTRRRENEALRQSEERFRKIADTLPAAIWLTDAKGMTVFLNKFWMDYCGSTLEESRSRGWRKFIHPDDLPHVTNDFHESVTSVKSWQNEFRLRRHDGSYQWFLNSGTPLFSPSGVLDGFVGYCANITKRRDAEQALAMEKQQLTVTLRSIGDGVVTTDTEGRISLLNREGEYLTGWTQAEAVGHPLSEVFRIVHEYTRIPLEDPVQKVLRTGRTIELANHTILISRDGKERVIADSAAPIRNAEDEIIGTVLVFRDSTQKEKLTEEILRSSKLESLGLLAGGIAHDFNNLLAAILGNISLLEQHPKDMPFAPVMLKDVRAACMRAKDLTQQLLTFAKGGAPVKKLADLKEVITESIQFALHGTSTTAEFNLAPNLYSVLIDPSQISQVLHNIILNAAQAMPHGGTIKITAQNLSDHPSGPMVSMAISDTGSGIPSDYLLRIFDPYFTTKPNGTGLGLASAYSIIKKHEGTISVESKIGVGTTFTIDLPAQTTQATTTPHSADSVIKGQGRLLVLEDDKMLARMLKLMLENLGYSPIVTHTGSQAIEIYREMMLSGQRFDGCLLDLTLGGGMSGAETFTHLAAIDPQVRALVCSGYSNDQIMAEFSKHGFRGVVIKPYSLEDISHAVQQMLV